MSKYRSRKVTVDGETFDSKKEYKRWKELQLLEKAGEIRNLRRQVKYRLLPSQYIYKDGEKPVCVERPVSYIADYVYEDKGGKTHVEDVKGYKGGGAYSVFSIKRKLMFYEYGIIVEEV